MKTTIQPFLMCCAMVGDTVQVIERHYEKHSGEARQRTLYEASG